MEIVFITKRSIAAPINGVTEEDKNSFEPIEKGTELYLRNRHYHLNVGEPNILNIPGTDTNVVIDSDDLEYVSGTLSDIH